MEIALVIVRLPPLAFILILQNLGAGKMRVLVCGGRDFDDAGLMISVLDQLHGQKSFTVLIHGDARGARRGWTVGEKARS